MNEEMACLKWPQLEEEEEVIEVISYKHLRVYVVVEQLYWMFNEKVADEIILVQYEWYTDHLASKDNMILVLMIIKSLYYPIGYSYDFEYDLSFLQNSNT